MSYNARSNKSPFVPEYIVAVVCATLVAPVVWECSGMGGRVGGAADGKRKEVAASNRGTTALIGTVNVRNKRCSSTQFYNKFSKHRLV
jgi:hypothetical protein